MQSSVYGEIEVLAFRDDAFSAIQEIPKFQKHLGKDHVMYMVKGTEMMYYPYGQLMQYPEHFCHLEFMKRYCPCAEDKGDCENLSSWAQLSADQVYEIMKATTENHQPKVEDDLVMYYYDGIYTEDVTAELMIDIPQKNNWDISLAATSETENLKKSAQPPKICQTSETWDLNFLQDEINVFVDDSGNQILACDEGDPLNIISSLQAQLNDRDDARSYTVVPKRIRYTEGGNYLVADDYAVIGKNDVIRLMENEGLTESEALERIKADFGLPYVFVVGNKEKSDFYLRSNPVDYQPAYHIDLVVTLGGTNDLGEEVIFYALPFEHKKLRVDTTSEKHATLHQRIEEMKKSLEEQMLAAGKRVQFIPVPFVYNDKSYVGFSYNNCFIEYIPKPSGKHARTAYVPVYCMNKTHAEMVDFSKHVIEAFTAAQYKVKWVIADFSYMARKEASLHCVGKVLKRNNDTNQ